jgi:hypothetical protein
MFSFSLEYLTVFRSPLEKRIFSGLRFNIRNPTASASGVPSTADATNA